MALSALKTWIAGEALTASDLNGEFANIYSNGEDLAWPATKAKDLNGQELILDIDGDTSITSDTDDQIDIRVGGADRVVIKSDLMTSNVGVVWSKGTDVVSTANLAVAKDGNYFDVTGTSTILSIVDDSPSPLKLHFDGAVTVTHHATDLVLPSGLDIITSAGDELEFFKYATGDWRLTNYIQSTPSKVWFPILEDLAANPATMSGTVGQYVEVGPLIYIQATIGATSIAGMSGSIFISGLPFTTSSSGFHQDMSFPMAYFDNVNTATTEGVSIRPGSGVTRLTLYKYSDASGASQMAAADITNTVEFRFQGWYFRA